MEFKNYSFNTPKEPEVLKTQFDAAQEQLGAAPEHALAPSSVGREEILRMSMPELRAKFARRFNMYVELLRQKDDFVDRSRLIEQFKKWLSALNSLDRYIQNHEQGLETTLRERQATVFSDIRDFLERGGTEGYVQLPTGVGKTVLFTELIEALDLKTLIVVPTNILVDQTVNKAEQFAPDIEVGVINSFAKEHDRKVIVTTYASLVQQIKTKQIDPREFDCLILDEAHEALSEIRKEAVGSFTNAIKLGFSATPDFSAQKKLQNLLPEAIHTMELREAIEDGLLSSVSAVFVRTSIDISNVKETSTGELNEKELDYLLNVEARNKAAIDVYKQMYSNQQAITYCIGVVHAKVIAKMFRDIGIPAASIDGEMPRNEQETILAKFHAGEIKVLCNADILIRGFDEPRASVCLNLRPTNSRVNAAQRGGRVLRLDPDNTHKHASIVDFIDGYGDTKESFRPVLFPTILGGVSFAEPRTRNNNQATENIALSKPPIVHIPGVEVITNLEEIVRITNENLRESEKKAELITDLEELKQEVRAAEVMTKVQYLGARKDHPRWPPSPNRYDNWISWPDLFGTTEKLITDLEELKQEVRAAGVTTADQYLEARKDHPRWPSEPYKLPNWVSYLDLFDKFITNLEELKQEVRAAGVTTRDQYMEARVKHPRWHSSPNKYIGDWISWPDLFGTTEKLITDLEELKQEVRAAGVTTADQYLEARKDHPRWPSSPNRYDNWISWHDLFRTTEKFITNLEELKQEVRTAGVTTIGQYQEARKNHPRWYSSPDKYIGDWISWPDLFGTTDKFITNLEELKQEVRAAGVTTRNQYEEARKNHPKWHSKPEEYVSGWISWPDLFGTTDKLITSLEELKQEVRAAGITTREQYRETRKNHPRWPSSPDKYIGDWISWPDLFGTKK